MMGIREGMKVLDVGCGVGGPAREIAKFTGSNIVGLNNNDYQIQRATHYAAKEGLSDQLSFTKGDFMVSSILPPQLPHLFPALYQTDTAFLSIANVLPTLHIRCRVRH